MSHRPAVTGLVALSLTAALAGCGAGLQSQTYQTRTAADASNVNVGALAVRNVSVLPPTGGRIHPVGGQARGVLAVTNAGSEPDRLIEATSPGAAEVVLTQDGKPGGVDIPASGSTGESAGFVLRGLTAPLGTGEYVTMSLRFERSGTVEVLVPVAVTGRSQRPARTGEPGSPEGEPALQGPAGGHSEGGGKGGAEGGAEGGAGAEPGGGGGEAERGQGEQGSAEAEPSGPATGPSEPAPTPAQ